MDIWSSRYDILFLGDDGGWGHFSPNLETLAGGDGGRDILARDYIISGDDQGRGDSGWKLIQETPID